MGGSWRPPGAPVARRLQTPMHHPPLAKAVQKMMLMAMLARGVRVTVQRGGGTAPTRALQARRH